MKKIWFAYDAETGSYIYANSGTELAKKLGLSNEAVYSAIKRSKEKGFSCKYGWFYEDEEEEK